ncbi:MAG: hypothetical protein IMZ50_14005 [Candidatus Atribacteria bacterium]|nr:hypothetical protein [Candidatus Atribacteria bacterium]
MSTPLYNNKLEWFKANEKPEVVLVVADDVILMRLVVAWATVPTSRQPDPAGPRGDGE